MSYWMVSRQGGAQYAAHAQHAAMNDGRAWDDEPDTGARDADGVEPRNNRTDRILAHNLRKTAGRGGFLPVAHSGPTAEYSALRINFRLRASGRSIGLYARDNCLGFSFGGNCQKSNFPFASLTHFHFRPMAIHVQGAA
jgi:hypothetical protein